MVEIILCKSPKFQTYSDMARVRELFTLDPNTLLILNYGETFSLHKIRCVDISKSECEFFLSQLVTKAKDFDSTYHIKTTSGQVIIL